MMQKKLHLIIRLLCKHSYSWGQCSWILKIFLIGGDIISWVSSFVAVQCKVIHYFVKRSLGG